jgi:hypothetical protein
MLLNENRSEEAALEIPDTWLEPIDGLSRNNCLMEIFLLLRFVKLKSSRN